MSPPEQMPEQDWMREATHRLGSQFQVLRISMVSAMVSHYGPQTSNWEELGGNATSQAPGQTY